MAITEPEWLSITNLIRRLMGQKGEYFITAKVIKRDEAKMCVYVKELGDQAIPIVDFKYEITYYDTNQTGQVIPKKAKVKTIVPAVGETVTIALEFGTRRLPRCIGVIQGRGWISAGEE